MKKTELNERTAFNSAEDLINKVNDRLLGGNMEEVPVIIEDFNLVQSKRDKYEVDEMAMRNVMNHVRKTGMRPNPSHRIDTSMLPDTYTDEEGCEKSFSEIQPEDPIENTLPAIITKEIMAAGINDIKWADTRDLPRGLDKDIRKLADAVFSAFNIDKNANVMTISAFRDNDFLNKPLELNSVLGFLEKNATSPHEGVLKQDFGQTIKGYVPTIKMYHTPSMAYLVVREPEGMGLEGDYIYAFKRRQEYKLKNEQKARISSKPRQF